MDYDVVRAYRKAREATLGNNYISNQDILIILEMIREEATNDLKIHFNECLKAYPED